jgi:hypothetical protein
VAISRPQQLAENVGIGWDRVTVDGAAALMALSLEAQLPFDANRDVRGYMGPDEWFSGSS